MVYTDEMMETRCRESYSQLRLGGLKRAGLYGGPGPEGGRRGAIVNRTEDRGGLSHLFRGDP